MDTLHIKTEHGHMSVIPENFFPAEMQRCRKLLKIIREFSWLNDVQEMAKQLNDHFTEQMAELDTRRKEEAGNYWHFRQRYVDYGNMLESGKHPDGVELTKEEIKGFKEKYRDAKHQAKLFESDFKRHTKQLELYKKNLELLGQL